MPCDAGKRETYRVQRKKLIGTKQYVVKSLSLKYVSEVDIIQQLMGQPFILKPVEVGRTTDRAYIVSGENWNIRHVLSL